MTDAADTSLPLSARLFEEFEDDTGRATGYRSPGAISAAIAPRPLGDPRTNYRDPALSVPSAAAGPPASFALAWSTVRRFRAQVGRIGEFT